MLAAISLFVPGNAFVPKVLPESVNIRLATHCESAGTDKPARRESENYKEIISLQMAELKLRKSFDCETVVFLSST